MKLSPVSLINFQKKQIASANILSKGKEQKVSIFQLDEKSDNIELTKIYTDPNWKNNYYLDEVISNFVYDFDKYAFYTIENGQGDILCISVTDEKNSNNILLETVETAPKLSCYNTRQRSTKYIGETMIAFLIKKAQQQDKNLKINYVAQRAKTKKFYFKQCGFEPLGTQSAILKRDKFDNLLKQHYKRTGSSINITG